MDDFTLRLKTILEALRARWGLEHEIDRFLSYIALDLNLTEDDLFPVRVTEIPNDFKMAVIAQIQRIIRGYCRWRKDKRGIHKVLTGIKFLESILEHGEEGFTFVHEVPTGYRLVRKASQ